MKISYSFWFLFLLLVSLASGQETLGTFTLGSEIQLVQNCQNSTMANISRIMNPFGNFTLNAQTVMTRIGDNYNYTFTSTQIPGNYIVYGNCDENGANTNWAYTFEITPTGDKLTTPKSVLFFLLLFATIIIFFLSLWGGISIPNRQTKNPMTGYIIAVDNIKYFKMFLIAISYIVLMLIFYISWMISFAYIQFDFLTSLFRFGFYLMVIAMVPLFIICVYVAIANLIRDSKIADMLSGGLRFKEGDDI